jgi:hypothetical protein
MSSRKVKQGPTVKNNTLSTFMKTRGIHRNNKISTQRNNLLESKCETMKKQLNRQSTTINNLLKRQEELKSQLKTLKNKTSVNVAPNNCCKGPSCLVSGGKKMKRKTKKNTKKHKK